MQPGGTAGRSHDWGLGGYSSTAAERVLADLRGRASSPLKIRVFGLQPCPRPAAHVTRADPLGDDAFDLAGLTEDGGLLLQSYHILRPNEFKADI
jgi:hypothetical protein